MRIYLLAASTALLAAPALAADPTQVAAADPVPVYEADMRGSTDVARGGYLKGSLGYMWTDLDGVDYAVGGFTGTFDTYDVDDTWTIGFGGGWHLNRYLRTELMFNYDFDSDFIGSTAGGCGVAVSCVSTDVSSWDAYSLIASLYVDLDFWSTGSAYGSFVPFIGGGIGGAYVSWNDLNNQSCEVGNPANCDPEITHEGESEWRFAYELAAGVAYNFSCDLTAEAAYRYRNYAGGAMFGNNLGGGPGYDGGFEMQTVNVGLRFYPGRDCEPEYVPPYVPPVYK